MVITVLAAEIGAADLVARCYDGTLRQPELHSHRIYRDRSGRLWLDFMSGADAYDGRYITSFADAIGGSGRYLYAMLSEPDGRIWLGHEGGVTVLGAGDRVLRQYGPADGLPPHSVTDIVRAVDGTLFVLTSAGVYRKTNERFIAEPLPIPARGDLLTDLVEAGDGGVAVLLDGHLFRYRSYGRWADATPKSPFPGESPRCLRHSPDARLTLSYPSGALLLDRQFERPVVFPFPPDLRREAFADALFLDPDTLLVLSPSALHVWVNGEWRRLRHPSGDVFDYRNRILLDPEGLLWIPHRSGILKLSRLDLERLSTEDGLPGTTFRAVTVDAAGGVLALGSRGASYRPPGAKVFRPLPPEDLAASGEFEAASPAPDSSVFLVGRHRLVRWTPGGGREVPLPPAVSGRWCDAAQAPDGALWIATRVGLFRVEGGGVRHWDSTRGLPHNVCLSVAVSPDGTVWAATLGGGLASIRGDSIRAYTTRDGLATDRLVDVEVAPDGSVWTCGFGGVSRLTGDRIATFTGSDLPALEDSICVHPLGERSYVFADGLVELDTRRHAVRQVFSRDDPAIDACSASFHSSLTVTPGGEVLLASDVSGGMYRWSPLARPVSFPGERDYRCRITSWSRDRQPLDIRETSSTLFGNWGRLRFEFTAASLWREEGTTFIYQLAGYDAGWSAPTSRHWVEYTQVGSGSRRFIVRARFADGTWSKPASLSLRIPPPWWTTPPVLAAALAALALAVWLVMRMSNQGLRRRQLRLEEQVNDRTRELEALNAQLQLLSTTDQLTGLANRRHFTEAIDRLASLVERSARVDAVAGGGGSDCMMLLFAMLDLDLFKGINDRFGHEAGDRVLQQTAEKLRSLVRESDLIVRWGGDEFLVVAVQRQSESLTALPQRLLDALRVSHVGLKNGSVIQSSCSIGFCRYPLRCQEVGLRPWMDSLRLADEALLLAKARGRNRAVGITDAGPMLPVLLAGAESLESAVAAGSTEVQELA